MQVLAQIWRGSKRADHVRMIVRQEVHHFADDTAMQPGMIG
jgi:hypothetical protein